MSQVVIQECVFTSGTDPSSSSSLLSLSMASFVEKVARMDLVSGYIRNFKNFLQFIFCLYISTSSCRDAIIAIASSMGVLNFYAFYGSMHSLIKALDAYFNQLYDAFKHWALSQSSASFIQV